MNMTPGGRVLVMGLAKSGEAAARLLHRHGMKVLVNDNHDPAKPDPAVPLLRAAGIEVVLGGHPLSLLTPRPDFIVKNPIIGYSVPLVAAAVEAGIPVYSEIEVATWFTSSPIYAITGSNGKTTTTTLVGEMLDAAGLAPMVAGNIGRAFSGVVEQVEASQPIVLEVSSFQLLGTEHFHPRIGALLNLYPAHLDYHGTFAEYVAAKLRLFANMTADDVAVLNYDAQPVRDVADGIAAQKTWFSRATAVTNGVFTEDGHIVIARDGHRQPVLAVADVALRGEHNLENVLAATAIAAWAGAPVAAIADVLAHFRSVEHRLEFVRSVGGVDYINDSKATNSQAALIGLRSAVGRVVWIAGGLDRGDDFALLTDVVRQQVKHAVLLGQSAPRVEALCERLGVPSETVASLADAVVVAHRLAEAGDVVLLSPACASWDMFASFEERGGMFKQFVHRL